MASSEEGESHQYKSTLPGFLGTIDTFISRFEALILALGVILMAANTVINVIGRFVFQHSIFFTGELNRILIILITFAGIGYAARYGRHIRMSAIFDVLSTKLRKNMMIIISIITAITMFALCYYSIGYIISVADSGRILPSLQFPVFIIYLWVPVGFFITGIQYALTAVKNLTEKDVYLSTHVLEGYDDDELEI